MNKKFSEDEEELCDMIVVLGVEEIISIAKKRFEYDKNTFLLFLVEIQNALDKLGYDFDFKISNKGDY